MTAPKVEVGQKWRVFGFKASPTYKVYHIHAHQQFAMMECVDPMSSALLGAALHLFNNQPGGYEFVSAAPSGEREAKGE